MTSYIVELSEYQGLAGSSNGEWSNTFQRGLTLEDGDELQIKQTLINSQSASADSINVTEDTVARITVGIYDNPVSPLTTNDEMLPSNMQQGANNPATHRWEIFDSTAPGYIESKGVDVNGTLYNTPWVAMTYDGSTYSRVTVDIDVTIPRGIYQPSQISDMITKAMQLADTVQVSNNDSGVQTSTPANISAGSVMLCALEHFDAINGATELTSADNEFLYIGKEDSSGVQKLWYVVGAPTPAMIYENERFKFEFFHTPVLLNADGDSSKAPFTVIGASNYGESESFLSKYSGIYLIDLVVVSGLDTFWNTLGFEQALFTDDDCSNLEDFSTQCFINSGAYENKAYSLPMRQTVAVGALAGFNFFISSDVSTSIDADSNLIYDESGYYLVNVISTFNNNYLTEDSTLSKVSCVASKQYSAGDYITAYAESGIVYQHKGEPIMLSKYQVQILEPKTRQIADDLGKNSTIFIEVIKSNPISKKQ